MRIFFLVALFAAVVDSFPRLLRTKTWIAEGPAPRDRLIPLVFAIRGRNLKKLEALLREVSNPNSPKYGKHLSLRELGELTSNWENTHIVERWLRDNAAQGIMVTTNGDFITADIPAWSANRVFKARFVVYRNSRNDETITRAAADAFEIPTSLKGCIDFIGKAVGLPPVNVVHPVRHPGRASTALPQPTRRRHTATRATTLPRYTIHRAMAGDSRRHSRPYRSHPTHHRTRSSRAGEEERRKIRLRSNAIISVPQAQPQKSAPGETTPDILRQFYYIGNAAATHPNATQSLFESLGQSFAPSDLENFQSVYHLPPQPVAQVIGPNTPSSCGSNPDACGEASLDVQYMMAVAQGAATTVWNMPTDDQEPFLDWIVAVAGTVQPPLVHSVSYGDVEQAQAPGEMRRFCEEVAKLGSRGVTVLVASGDDGVANFVARGNQSDCGFHPAFPASCPYVTAVGATKGPETGQSETACTSDNGGLITTGGGFSTVFDRPSYQDDAVLSFLNESTALPPLRLFASHGRGYPDISVAGHNYAVIIGGTKRLVSGTSASAPVFAAMLTLINSARLEAGKAPLGFVNPALYQLHSSHPKAFNDVTAGENNCCAGQFSEVCCPHGFTARRGWDPVVGLGSPHFAHLQQAMLDLP